MKRLIALSILALCMVSTFSFAANSVHKAAPGDRYIVFEGATPEELAIEINKARAGGCKLRGELFQELASPYLFHQVCLCPPDFSTNGGTDGRTY